MKLLMCIIGVAYINVNVIIVNIAHRALTVVWRW